MTEMTPSETPRPEDQQPAPPAETPAEDPQNAAEELGPGGMSLGVNADGTQRREIGGGAITRELAPPPPDTTTQDPLRYHRRYMISRLARDAGNIIGRAPENIGFFGKGDVYHGNGGILIDIDSLEKVRVQDGYRFEGDEVYANTRDLPHALVDGDVANNLAGPG